MQKTQTVLQTRGKYVPGGLKLRAEDAEDLKIISASMQGAITSANEIAYVAHRRELVLLASRFCWEETTRGFLRFWRNFRTRTALRIGDVLDIRFKGFTPGGGDQVLELLAILHQPGEEAPEARLELVFAGDGGIRLHVECINVYMEDTGRAWWTPHRPRYDTETAIADDTDKPAT